MFAKGVRNLTEVAAPLPNVSVWSRDVDVPESIKMTAQCALVSRFERPVLPDLLLDVQQKLLGVSGLVADSVRERTWLDGRLADWHRRQRPASHSPRSDWNCRKVGRRIRIRERHTSGDVARHIEVCVADVLAVEDAVAGPNYQSWRSASTRCPNAAQNSCTAYP